MFEVACIANLPLDAKQEAVGRFKGAAMVAKPLGSVWGSDERKLFRISEWPIETARDQEIMDELNQQIKDGETNPCYPYPFCVTELREVEVVTEDGKTEMQMVEVMTLCSTKGIDIDALPPTEKAETLDTSKESATLAAEHVVKVSREVTKEGSK